MLQKPLEVCQINNVTRNPKSRFHNRKLRMKLRFKNSKRNEKMVRTTLVNHHVDDGSLQWNLLVTILSFFTDFLMVLFSGRMYYRSCLTMLIVHQHPKIDTNTESSNLLDEVTVMLVTSLCWWLYDGDRFEMLVAESLCWWFFQCIKSVTNILNRSPIS